MSQDNQSNSQDAMQYHFASAHVGGQFKQNVTITVAPNGVIADIQWDQSFSTSQKVMGHALPGMANVHSHAFQRAMAGMAEYRQQGQNSFWSWRNTMYRLANQMTPDKLSAVANQLYVEMVKAGYTSVGEFHYLHNSHQNAASEMGQVVLNAAANVGLPMTLLPVLYQTSDFGAAGPVEKQKAFVNSVDEYLKLVDSFKSHLGDHDQLGIALHSLRAVPAEALKETVSAFKSGPIHIHIAEQMKEVEASEAFLGKRPVEWLMENIDVNNRWTLIHATHLKRHEMAALVHSGAVAGVCPTTEANLGDGFFKSKTFLSHGGVLAIGSDSHVSVDLREELRILEYVERLRTHERCVLASADGHTGERLYSAAAIGGAQSIAQPIGSLDVGKRADIVVLDLDAPTLIGATYGQILDAFIFSGQGSPVGDVMIAGNWVVRGGQHAKEEEILSQFKAVMIELQE